jgi:hypothetical protein
MKNTLFVFVVITTCSLFSVQTQAQQLKNWISGGLGTYYGGGNQNRTSSSDLNVAYYRFLNEKHALGLVLVAEIDYSRQYNSFFRRYDSRTETLVNIGFSYLRLYSIANKWNWAMDYSLVGNKEDLNARVAAHLFYSLNEHWILGANYSLANLYFDHQQRFLEISARANTTRFSPAFSLNYRF